MEKAMEYLGLLLPVILLELALAVTALVHVLRHKKYKMGSRLIWIPVVLFIQILGPVAYFLLGRSDEG